MRSLRNPFDVRPGELQPALLMFGFFFSIIAVLMSESAAECLLSLAMYRCFLEPPPSASVAEMSRNWEGVRPLAETSHFNANACARGLTPFVLNAAARMRPTAA